MITAADDRVTVADLVQVLRTQQNGSVTAPAPEQSENPTSAGGRNAAQTVVVIGAHAGAGTTAVAVAIADSLAALLGEQGATGVQLIDTAGHGASGMTAAAQREIAGTQESWRAGRRGASTLLRPEISPTCPSELPSIHAPDSGWLVVDAAWRWREVLAVPNPIRPLLKGTKVVLVCRASVPGVRQVELALHGLPGLLPGQPGTAGQQGWPVVAAVGARRWPPAVQASFGPRLARIVSGGRSVLVPGDRRVEVNGIDAKPLPTPIAAAASRIVTLLGPEAPASTQTPTKKPAPRGFRR